MRYLLAVCTVLVFATCGPKIQSALLDPADITYRSSDDDTSTNINLRKCRDALAYAPDTTNPSHQYVQQIRVNFHIMDSDTGVHNFGLVEGREFVHAVLDMCNEKLRNNIKMHLPPGNETPVLPPNYQMVLAPDPSIPGDDGIYFQNDPDLYYFILGRNSNKTSREVVNKYSVRKDSVINIFLQPHHPDSVGRKDYRAVGTGIMLGTSIKISQIFSKDPPPLSCVGLLNHEMGHVLGLSHTWRGSDGCDDTPAHSNCWDYTKTPPCDTFVSNNLMDYNKWQWALTPCQIGRVHRNMSDPGGRVRRYLVPQWCDYDSTATVIVNSTTVWEGARDVRSDILIRDDASLELRCRLSLPDGARIIVSPKATLILNDCEIENTCGDDWYGIEILRTRSDTGSVEVIGKPVISNVLNPVDLNTGR